MKWRWFVAEAAEDVGVAAGEVPDVAGFEIVGLGAALRIDDGGAHAAADDERPFGGGCVPVELAHDAGLENHGDAGDAFRDGQLLDGGLAADAVADRLPADFSSSNLNVGSSLPAEHGIGDVVVGHGKLWAAKRANEGVTCTSITLVLGRQAIERASL